MKAMFGIAEAVPLSRVIRDYRFWVLQLGLFLAPHVCGLLLVVLAAAGNVTINAPSSGVALTVNGSTQVDTGAVIWTIAEDGSGAYLDLSGSNNFRIYTGSAERIRVGNTGIVTINAPSSDTALILPAAATGYSSMRLPHGAAPSAPVNGDMWTTTAGLFVRINGATVGPLT